MGRKWRSLFEKKKKEKDSFKTFNSSIRRIIARYKKKRIVYRI